jgi:hypothetical protein
LTVGDNHFKFINRKAPAWVGCRVKYHGKKLFIHVNQTQNVILLLFLEIILVWLKKEKSGTGLSLEFYL